MNNLNNKLTYLVTGSAGFIGFHLSQYLLEQKARVIGFDNLNDYYDVSLKKERLSLLSKYNHFTFIKGDLSNKQEVESVFATYNPNIVVNLAAQAGVRYSIDNPYVYIESNIVGYANILECCRKYPISHLVFASSSSVYGGNTKVPFSTEDKVDRPISLYAATKASNELMAYSYSKLYDIPITGLRFFTVYGPLGRPDMAYYKFSKMILEDKPIPIYNYGNLMRDFTYIDDIINGIVKILPNTPKIDDIGAQYKIYNIGNSSPVSLLEFITTIEKHIGKEAKKEFLPMQKGDVYQTYADVSDLERDFNFKPVTSLDVGIKRFIDWFLPFYNKAN